VIRPLVGALSPTRIVEIGALRGDTTVELLATLGDDAELHVIDPAPQFDPSEHERRFAGRYVMHRDLSLNVLPQLPPLDLALIDGDHNWFTVHHELRLLDAGARAARRPPPVMVLHDVQWPYGRRDGYYTPEDVPSEWRQPCAFKGLVRGSDALAEEGGLNRHVCNALHEGGPRNGVLTALEDFLAEPGREYTSVVLDLYVGLAVAADAARLADRPALAALMAELTTDAARARLQHECEAVVREAFASGKFSNA
jgi:hypothetical protein